MASMSAHQIVKHLKDQNQDFEWYPTTEPMIEAIKDDIRKMMSIFREDPTEQISVLDCGAGDGRVLEALTQGDRFAIEKSELLVAQQDPSVITVGTDLMQQVLIDKRVSVTFSNPPYSRFSDWAVKIISEANAKLVYLILPERWESDKAILNALEARQAEAEVIEAFDFDTPEADRRARARVHVLRIQLTYERHLAGDCRIQGLKVDPFDLWFQNNFAQNAAKADFDHLNPADAINERVKRRVSNGQDLVSANGLVQALEIFYHEDLNQLLGDYERICKLDSVLLYELGVNTEKVAKGLKQKIMGLKDAYWRTLFDHLKSVTERLTKDSRSRILEKLHETTHIDFSAANAHGLLSWVIKTCNQNFDRQLIELVERMTKQANVVTYKSNQKVFEREEWAYGQKPDIERYGLDYRIVLDLYQAICVSEHSYQHTNSGLTDYAANLLDDIATVANNLGFDTTGQKRAHDYNWESGKKVNFHYWDHTSQRNVVLFEAKAYKKGTIHLKLNQRFACKLNTEFGRLKGWLRTAQEAHEEMDIPKHMADEAFGSNTQLTGEHMAALGYAGDDAKRGEAA